MKLNPSSKTALLALSAAALSATSASAALSYNFGDLFIGFRRSTLNVDTTTTVKPSDYAINLGAAGTFRDATAPIVLTLGTGVISDLNAALGAGWDTDSLTQYGLGATNGAGTTPGDAAQTLYTSKATGSPKPKSNLGQSGPSNSMLAFENGYFLTLTEGSVPNGAQGSTSNQDSFSTRAGANYGASGVLAPVLAPITSTIELFRIPQGNTQSNVTDEGTFSFDHVSGTLTFTPTGYTAPIPEPSTALFGCVAVGALVARRRRAVLA